MRGEEEGVRRTRIKAGRSRSSLYRDELPTIKVWRSRVYPEGHLPTMNKSSLSFGRTSAGIVWCFWGIFDTIHGPSKIKCVCHKEYRKAFTLIQNGAEGEEEEDTPGI